MEIGPIIRAMLRNKLGMALIALQIAFTMTVIVNAISIVQERTTLINKPSGLDEDNLFYLSSIGYGEQFNELTSVADDLDYLRRTPGVRAATQISAIPVSGSGSATTVRTQPDITKPGINAAYYRVDEHAIDTMGVNLIAGENFTAGDVRIRESGDHWTSQKTIISQALAEKLFPGEALNAVGKTLYQAEDPVQIIGIVERLQGAWPNSELVERSMLVAENSLNGATTYLVRTESGERDRLMIETEEYLATSGSYRIIRGLRSMDETRDETFRIDKAMRTILYIVIGTLIFITSMGIVGLAVFGINQRKKQIGTRRALGATRLQILRYFLLENFFITSIGVVVGAGLTAGMSYYLSTNFNMTPIDMMYIAYGMLALITVGQLSALGPSTGAAQVAPAVATRTV